LFHCEFELSGFLTEAAILCHCHVVTVVGPTSEVICIKISWGTHQRCRFEESAREQRGSCFPMHCTLHYVITACAAPLPPPPSYPPCTYHLIIINNYKLYFNQQLNQNQTPILLNFVLHVSIKNNISPIQKY